MKNIIEQQMGVPASNDIHPLAEYSFEKLEQDTGELLAPIKQFDQIINGW